MSTTPQVVFHANEFEADREYVQDKVVIQTETATYELQVRASVSKANVRVEGDLNLGLLPSDSKATKRFQLVNDGGAPAQFRIDWDRCAVRVRVCEGGEGARSGGAACMLAGQQPGGRRAWPGTRGTGRGRCHRRLLCTRWSVCPPVSRPRAVMAEEGRGSGTLG